MEVNTQEGKWVQKSKKKVRRNKAINLPKKQKTIMHIIQCVHKHTHTILITFLICADSVYSRSQNYPTETSVSNIRNPL